MRKFPLYRQHDSMQCGVTCLRMICAYWGKEYPAEYLDRLCGASREGVSLLGISETAAELGLKSVCGRLTTGQLAEVELPAILHWNQNHFVVLYKISRKRGGKTVYHVADPGKGLRQYDGPSFEAGWIETRTVLFSLLTFLVFGGVLLVYDPLIFAAFGAGSLLYGLWIAFFLGKRKRIDYELFEKEAENNNKTYRFITTMQEIKLQDCEQRRRWEWEDVQAGLFRVQAKSLKLRQAQEAGGILITQVKNILVTVLAATAVINGQMTLGMMLAVQYIIGQLNRPVEQLMRFIYASQDLKISLDRINEIHGQMEEEDGSIDTARLARAVEIANIKEFIQSLPLRYDTVIGPDGIELSALVPYRFAPRINGATPVVVRLEGTTAKATILRTGDETVANEQGNFLRIVLLVRDATPGPYGPKVNMRGRASFTLSDKCLFRYLTGR